MIITYLGYIVSIIFSVLSASMRFRSRRQMSETHNLSNTRKVDNFKRHEVIGINSYQFMHNSFYRSDFSVIKLSYTVPVMCVSDCHQRPAQIYFIISQIKEPRRNKLILKINVKKKKHQDNVF